MRRPRTRPRAAHLTSVHRAGDVRILHKECRTLAAAGWDVRLVAPHPQVDELAGVPIIPVGTARGRFDRMTRIAREVLRAAVALDADVYHVHDPELLPVALWLKARGARVVYDAHEDVPRQILSKEWMPRPVRSVAALAAAAWEAVAAWTLDLIVAASPTIAARFPADRCIVVRNYPRLEDLAAVRQSRLETRPPNVLYLGSVAPVRGALEMVRAMVHLPEDLPTRLLLVGPGESEDLDARLSHLPGWDRVERISWLVPDQVATVLGRAQIGLHLPHPLPNYVDAPFATKLLEYLGAGMPAIMSDIPAWRTALEPYGCVEFANPLDPAAIAAAIGRLLHAPGEAAARGARGRALVYERWNWDPEGRRLVAAYDRLMC